MTAHKKDNIDGENVKISMTARTWIGSVVGVVTVVLYCESVVSRIDAKIDAESHTCQRAFQACITIQDMVEIEHLRGATSVNVSEALRVSRPRYAPSADGSSVVKENSGQ